VVERSISTEVARDVSVDKLLLIASIVTPVKTPLTSAIICPGVTAKCPVEPPLASVVPNVKRSFASSHPMNTFADVSRYINIPESFIAPFVNPLFKLIKLSEISKFVVLIVVVVPFTVKFPDMLTSPVNPAPDKFALRFSTEVARDVSVLKLVEMNVSAEVARDVSVLNVVEICVSVEVAREVSVLNVVERSVSVEVARDVSVDKLL